MSAYKRNITTASDVCDHPGSNDLGVWTNISAQIEVATFQFNTGGDAGTWRSFGWNSASVATTANNPNAIELEFTITNSTGGNLWIDNAAMRFLG